MSYVLLGALAILVLVLLYRLVPKGSLRRLRGQMRWIVGGAAALLSAFLLVRGRVDFAGITGAAAFSILKFGRLGPLTFESETLSADNDSAVRSRYIAMRLDHATGDISGKVKR